MKLLWTKSSNPFDWLIEVATGEDCAHFAILFEGYRGTGVVFESNLLGTHPAFFKTWSRKRRIIHSIDVPADIKTEDALWERWVEHYDGKGYDVLGALYLGIMKLRKRIFGIELPERNRWAKDELFFCNEIYQLVSGMPGCPPISSDSNGMDTPHDVYRKIKLAGGIH